MMDENQTLLIREEVGLTKKDAARQLNITKNSAGDVGNVQI